MRTATIVLACAAAAALVTVDHVAATSRFASTAKSDRLNAPDGMRAARDSTVVQTRDNTTIAIRTRGADRMARDVARQPASSPTPAKQPAKSGKRLPQACEPSVSPLASNTTFGARCVT